MNKPFAEAAEQNKDPILQVIKKELEAGQTVLELGSGTGQHAVWFASQISGITWQPTDLAPNLAGIQQWVDESALPNVATPLALDVGVLPWPVKAADACYSCNTFHIVSTENVEAIFTGAAQVLSPDGKLIVYGPFSHAGKHQSESNERFDRHLRASDINAGVRDLYDLNLLAVQQGFREARIIPMPVNNQIAIWERPGN